MTTICSQVESIPSILKKENAQGTLEIHGWQQLLKVEEAYEVTILWKMVDLESVFHI